MCADLKAGQIIPGRPEVGACGSRARGIRTDDRAGRPYPMQFSPHETSISPGMT